MGLDEQAIPLCFSDEFSMQYTMLDQFSSVHEIYIHFQSSCFLPLNFLKYMHIRLINSILIGKITNLINFNQFYSNIVGLSFPSLLARRWFESRI